MINHRSRVSPVVLLFFFLFLLGISQTTYAQCAGTDATVTVCEKDQDQTNTSFPLAPLLGAHEAGGRWSTDDPATFNAIDRITGVVDLWLIRNFGVHEFTYIVDSGTCSDSAIITINLGGFPGEDNIDGSANACGDNSAVNLHSFLGSEIDGKIQDFNGIWEAVTPGIDMFLNNNIFDAEGAGAGEYSFTHTVGAVGICPPRVSNVVLEVHRPPDAGERLNMTFCIDDDLSAFTAVDLRNRLTDEDENGTWSDDDGTNQISALDDSIIDIQAIRDTYGIGDYSFTYTVPKTHPICDDDESTVTIFILPKLVGTLSIIDACTSSFINVEVDYDPTLLPNGPYTIAYVLSGSSGNNTQTASLSLTDGMGSFNVSTSFIPENEFVSLTITDIGVGSTLEGVCNIREIDRITILRPNASAGIADTCAGIDTTVSLTEVLNASGSLANENLDVNYTVTGPNGMVNNYTEAAVVFSSGNGSFTMPAANYPEAGTHMVAFEVINMASLTCELTDSFVVTPIPEAIELSIVVDNSCDATQIDVMVEAPILADGSYDIIYDVTEQNSGQVVINNTINFVGGTATYDLDVASLEPGNYTVSVRSTQDDTTACRIIFDFEETQNFAIAGIPELPEGDAEQTFCLGEFIPDGPTLADIAVSSNGQILFYDTDTSTDILPIDTSLVNGEDYFASAIDSNNNCEGSQRIRIEVTFIDPAAPTSTVLNPAFCAADNPTLTNFTANVPAGMEVVWFNAESGGTALDVSTPLADGIPYFAATQANSSCLSQMRLEFVPTVYALEPASLLFANLEICGLDNPTVADLFQIEGDVTYDVLWYDVPENGAELTDDVLLQEDVTYYAQSFNPVTGCINPERMAVTVDLSDCDLEAYDFFIPDGFSPNGDGRNDTFYIPNIETIFPDFSLEILNRYGSSLFKGNINAPAWDGSNGSGTAPNGVYFYVIKFNKDGKAAEQGKLYLNR